MSDAPDEATREELLDVLAELVARGGAARFLAPPVAPGDDDFPDRWAPTRAGVQVLLRRLAWHAGVELAIEVDDQRVGEAPTERKPTTRVSLVEVRRAAASFVLEFLGDDDVAGTLAHEIGVAFSVLHPPGGGDPYRTPTATTIAVDPDVDLERGSIATVYLGLGVLAANAARQQHTVLERQRFNPLLVSSVGVQVETGYVDAEAMSYLVAVQAVARGEREPPPGLTPAQRRSVAAWIGELDRTEICARLGIVIDAADGGAADSDAAPTTPSRPRAVAFADTELAPDPEPSKNAFRWPTHRGGVGFVTGVVLGLGISVATARTMMPVFVFGGGFGGHLVGRRVRVPRCSACSSVLPPAATKCPSCGAAIRGDIASLSDRLEAEEQLSEREKLAP